jgi:NADH:ubiquinone oxidoreductase subunit E
MGAHGLNLPWRALKLGAGEKTTSDRAFTVEKVRCMGCCSIAPAVQVNQDQYGQVTQNSVANILRKYGKV